MTPIQIALIPGKYLLTWLLLFLEVNPNSLEPGLFIIFSAFLSFLFWTTLLKAGWKIVTRGTVFDNRRGQYR